MEKTESRIGAAVRAARVRRGWTREALAYHSGVSFAAVAQIESGRRKDVRLTSLSALAGALGVTVDHLVGAEDGRVTMLRHHVLLYGSDHEFVSTVAPFAAEGVARDEPVLIVTTPPRIALVRAALGNGASRVEFGASSDWYRTPATTLARYREFVDDRIAAGALWVRAVGEPVWARRTPAQVATWIRYESLLNAALAGAPATILCPYDTRVLPARVLTSARHTHPQLTTPAGDEQNPDYRPPEALLLGR